MTRDKASKVCKARMPTVEHPSKSLAQTLVLLIKRPLLSTGNNKTRSRKSRTGAPTFQTPLCRRLEGGQMLVGCIVSHCLLFWLFFCLPCLCRYFFCLCLCVFACALLLVLEIFLG